MRLNQRQQKFAEFVLRGDNQSEAYKKAGYKPKTNRAAGTSAARLVANVRVAKYIADRQGEINEKLKETTQVTKERIVSEYAKVAFANMSDFAEMAGGNVTFRDFKELRPEQLAAVAELGETTTKDGGSIRLRLHSKVDALTKLAEHLGMFKINVQLRPSFEDFLREMKR